MLDIYHHPLHYSALHPRNFESGGHPPRKIGEEGFVLRDHWGRRLHDRVQLGKVET